MTDTKDIESQPAPHNTERELDCPAVPGSLIREKLNEATKLYDKWFKEYWESNGLMDSFAEKNAGYYKGKRDALRELLSENAENNYE